MRNIDQQRHRREPNQGPASARVLASDDLSEMFGIEMAPATPKRAATNTVATEPSTAASVEASSKQTRLALLQA